MRESAVYFRMVEICEVLESGICEVLESAKFWNLVESSFGSHIER
jgi:hypothetical protein